MTNKEWFIKYALMIIEKLHKEFDIKYLYAIDIYTDGKFSFDKNLFHEIIVEVVGGKKYHIKMTDPYEPFHEWKYEILDEIKEIKKFTVMFKFSPIDKSITIYNE